MVEGVEEAGGEQITGRAGGWRLEKGRMERCDAHNCHQILEGRADEWAKGNACRYSVRKTWRK